MKILFIILTIFILSFGCVRGSEFDRLLKKAEKGDADAQCEVGLRYLKGNGVKTNIEEASKWTEKAAEQKCAKAQFNLGVFYNTGIGREKDYKKGIQWMEKAADNGYPKAQSNIAYMYFFGYGTSVNKTKTKYWLEKFIKNKEASENLKEKAKQFWNEHELEKY